MSKKITISVPDELHEKMNEWRSSFNFSQVFQEAISKKISNKEKFLSEREVIKDMDAIIERLREEKLEAEGDWFEVGKEDGFDWAAFADYKEIQSALNMEIGEDGFPDDSELAEYFQNYFDMDGMAEATEWNDKYRRTEPNEQGQKFIEGWKIGVEEFWDRVKDKI